MSGNQFLSGAKLATFTCALALGFTLTAHAQAPAGRGPAAPPPTPQAMAPLDITGYWVSIVTEDWRIRMVTPEKGDVPSVPLNPEGRRVANEWDADKDIAAGNACKAYGAPALSRVPGRLHISWSDDHTLKMEADAGTQTRVFHFVGQQFPLEDVLDKQPDRGKPSLQGYSVAQWSGMPGGRGGGPREGFLSVLTDDLTAGYLRKNGVPYSENAILKEYFDSFTEPNGDKWLVVTTIVTDPKYLAQPFVTSTHFKRQADAAGWNPSACEAK